MSTEKRINAKKIMKSTLIVALALILLATATVLIMFQGELRTLGAIKRIEDKPLFTMEYKADYDFDDFLETGASTDAELMQYVTKKLLKGLPISFDLPDLGCSTFTAATPDGDAIFGRNFDMYYSPALFVKTAPKDGYASISMVNLSYIGYGEDYLPDSLLRSIITLAAPYAPLDGMNEKGVAIGVLLIDTEPTNQQTDKPDITTTTAIRMILDKAASVDEALELLQSYDMHSSANSSYHFQIADASGRSVVVEYIGDEINVIEETKATNFLLTEGDWDFGGGHERFEILESTLNKNGGIMTEQEGMDLLSSVKQVKKVDKTSTTQWSAIYNLSKGTLNLAVQMDYDSIYSFSIK